MNIELFYQEENDYFYNLFVVGIRRPKYSGNTYSSICNLFLHNPHGPAVIREDNGLLRWYIDGHFNEDYSTDLYCKSANLSKEDTLLFHITYGDKLPDNINDLHPMHNPILTMSPVYNYNISTPDYP